MTAVAVAAALVGVAAGLLVGGAVAYWWACHVHAGALTESAERAERLQAHADGLVALMTAQPPGPHRAACAEWRAKQIAAVTQSAIREGRKAVAASHIRPARRVKHYTGRAAA